MNRWEHVYDCLTNKIEWEREIKKRTGGREEKRSHI
jgi:hypothetical protein